MWNRCWLELGGAVSMLSLLTALAATEPETPTAPAPGGRDRPCFLGVRTALVEEGAVIGDVVAESPAARLGLMAGDVIVEIDGFRLGAFNGHVFSLESELRHCRGRVTLKVMHRGGRVRLYKNVQVGETTKDSEGLPEDESETLRPPIPV